MAPSSDESIVVVEPRVIDIMESKKQITKTSIILTDSDKWDDRMGTIRRIALGANIWENIDPGKDEVPLINPSFQLMNK